MNNNKFKLLCEFDRFLTKLYRPLTKIAIGIILITVFFVSCVQIIDRSEFHKLVKTAATEEVKKRCVNNTKDFSLCVNDSNKEKKEYDHNVFPQQSTHSHDDSLLDVLSKSDGLLNANGITYCVTLIVALLASLLLYRIETMEKLVEENNSLKEETKSYYTHAVRFDNILTRLESAYNMTILIGNITTTLLHTKTDNEGISISTNIGHLCTRLSLICSEIDDRLNKRESRLDYLSKDENNIIEMYLEDTIDELRRSLSFINRAGNKDLQSILNNNIHSIEYIKETIDAIIVNRE